jgi:hypothetical protein
MRIGSASDMTVHELKSWPEFFAPVASQEKTFELRRNDRDYQVGDVLVLREWKPDVLHEDEGEYTGRSCRRRISYVLEGLGTQGVIAPLRGLSRGYAILALEVSRDE